MQFAPADSTQLDAILEETYPIWGEGLSLSAYRSWNRGQMATRWGRNHLRRLVLTDAGAVLASAKRYDFEARVGSEIVAVVGIGAVFTPEALRGRGHARVLIDLMIQDAEARGCRYALLFSEIGAPYYESMGFRTMPRAMQSIEIVRKPGAPATFVRSGEASDLAEIANINRGYASDAAFALVRTPEQIEFSFSRRRLQAGLGPPGRRVVEFFVSEEGHRPVAYVFITRGPPGSCSRNVAIGIPPARASAPCCKCSRAAPPPNCRRPCRRGFRPACVRRRCRSSAKSPPAKS